VDREALDHSIVRRLLDHIENGTTDLTDDVLELSTSSYSAEHHAEEVESLFFSQPLVLTLSGALPAPGTYQTLDICGVPLLLTRDAKGKVHSFANVCRHRAVRVADGGGKARRLTCPFHAWVYDLEGKLTHVPVADAFEGMCIADKGLVELPVAEGYGLIVGRLRHGDPVEIDDYLGAGTGLSDELAMLDFADWGLYAEPHVHQVASNWKVALDTFRENYHFNYLHRTTLASYAYGGVLTFDEFGRHLRNCSALRSIDELKELPEKDWEDVSRHFSYQYALFPNTSMAFDARHIELWQILPIDESHCEVIHTAFIRPGISEEEVAKFADMAPWICKEVVDGEDFWVSARTEPGVRTGLLDSVMFGRNEPAPQHLHRGYAEVMAEARAEK
jgi:choline monooxygenase